MNTSPDASILGLGYLGRPLAQKLYEHDSRVAAIKRSLTSDDINLPVHLDTIDLNQRQRVSKREPCPRYKLLAAPRRQTRLVLPACRHPR